MLSLAPTVLLILSLAPLGHTLPAFKSWSRTAFRVDYPFQNVSLPWAQRVDDLVARLTLEEVQGQLTYGAGPPNGGPAPAIPRFGIGPYQWWSNCGRGDAGAPGNATAFPQGIGLSASFSPDLRYRVAVAAAEEVRAKHNVFVKEGNYSIHTGLSCFSPDIDIFRDPRWGRNQETPGEDPYMNGVQSQFFVRGIQGDHPRYVRVSAGCKHYAVYAGPESYPVSRMGFNAEVSMRDLRMSFLPQFKMCIDAGSYSVMSSYNAVNGVPVCANKFLLTQVLRNEWNFTGYVLADAGAIENVVNAYHYANNSVDAAAACLNAGCNIEVAGGKTLTPYYLSIVEAVEERKLDEGFVRESLKPLFYTRMRLGEFDPAEMNPYADIDPDVVESAGHQALAVEAAMKSFVLLKNDVVLPYGADKGILPFTALFQTIGVVGPMANNSEQLFGNYQANTDPSFTSTPLDGLRKVTRDVQFASGCNSNVCDQYNASAVHAAVTGTQINFVVLGTGQAVETEGQDRETMELSGYQKQLLSDVLATSPDAPLILLLYAASPVNITDFADDARVSAIVQGFFPAQAAGTALAHLMLNDVPGASPAGRLPYTWPALASQIPPMVNYSMEGRTYRYFRGEPLYPFGYGLSYVKFRYPMFAYGNVVNAGDNLTGYVMVENLGDMDADEAVQVYISWVNQSLPAPQLQLAWFDRVTVGSQSQVRVNFTVDARQMALWFDDGWEVREGDMMLYVGGQQPGQKRQAPSNVLVLDFKIQGSKYLGKY